MHNKLLIINDITSYGRVSSFAMYPILAKYGLHPYFLPTALVSNTLDYGRSEILDTSDWMKRTITTWQELGFTFDIMSIGLINSKEQVSIISALIDEHKPSLVVLDPIMGDSGKLYPGMYESVVECNKHLASKADILMPNYTEACMLSGYFADKDLLSNDDNDQLLQHLYSLGCKQIIVKGCKDEYGRKYNLVSQGPTLPYSKEYYEELPANFIGTGDVFSAVFISELLEGSDILKAVNQAADFVQFVINHNATNKDCYDLDIESCL